MMVGAVLFPIGLFWFAWTGNYPSIHWIVPTLSGLLTGAGIITIFLQALNYLIDAYLMVAASAIAANTFLRSFFGAGFPLLLRRCLIILGWIGRGSLLGFLAVDFLPIPFLFYIFGERLRRHSKYAPTDLGKKKASDEESGSRNGNEGEEEEKDE
jgi:DHA1 family multidrug resistance protein-like MFS transporter